MARQAESEGDATRVHEIRKALDLIAERAVEELQALCTIHDIAEPPSSQAMQRPPAHTTIQSDWIPAYRQLRGLDRHFSGMGGDAAHADFQTAADRISLNVMRRFRTLGGNPEHLRSHPSGATKTEQAYHAIEDMVRHARNSRDAARADEIRQVLETIDKYATRGVGQSDHEPRRARRPVHPGCPDHATTAHAATAGDGCIDNAWCATGANRTAGESPADDRATPRSIGYPRPGTPHRPGSGSCVPRTGRRARPYDRCPRSAPGVQSPRAFALRCRRHRNRRRASRRPRAREARPTRHHGRATDVHRGHRHALARRTVLVLAATGQPVAGAGHRSRRPRPAPRRRDRAGGCPRSAPGVQSPRAFALRCRRHRNRRRASRRPRAREARPTRHHGRATDDHRRHRHAPRSPDRPRRGCNRPTPCRRRAPFPSTPVCTTQARPRNRPPAPAAGSCTPRRTALR